MPSVAPESNAYTNDIATRVWKDDDRRILSILFTRVPNFDLEAVEFAKFGIVNVKKEGAASLNLDAVETVFIQGQFVWNICCGPMTGQTNACSKMPRSKWSLDMAIGGTSTTLRAWRRIRRPIPTRTSRVRPREPRSPKQDRSNAAASDLYFFYSLSQSFYS
jgi:hypothetical protein